MDAPRRAHVLADDTPRKRTFYERKLRRPAFLSSEIQQDILEGRQPVGLTLELLINAEPPLSWLAQSTWIGR